MTGSGGLDARAAWSDESERYRPSRRETVLLVLAGIFVTHAILGEVMGGKLIEVRGWIMSVGVLPWPVVFVTTDLVNEYYGPRAVRRLTLLAVGLILYAFAMLWIGMQVAAADVSPVSGEAFDEVFGQSQWIIIGSVIAFAVSQFLDAVIFVMARTLTGGKMLWLRAVGSTVVSQLVDTFVINSIAFGMGGQLDAEGVVNLSLTNYAYKFLIAVATLPVIYLGHGIVDRYLDGERT